MNSAGRPSWRKLSPALTIASKSACWRRSGRRAQFRVSSGLTAPKVQETIVDVLDAYASLESALRVADGRYEEVGGEVDGVGLVMRMVS
jgi:hypothetical protein